MKSGMKLISALIFKSEYLFIYIYVSICVSVSKSMSYRTLLATAAIEACGAQPCELDNIRF